MLTRECGPLDQIFTHIDPDTSEVRHFNASAMVAAVPEAIRQLQCQKLRAAIDPAFVRFVVEHRGVEPHRIASLTMAEALIPLIGVRMPDDSVLLVDGHHRLVYLDFVARAESYEIYVFGEGNWSQYLVTDMDERLHEFAVAMAGG